MKIKINMYARTLDGICKIVDVIDDGRIRRFVNEDGNVYFFNDLMCNPSFDIIDLIRKGDYVNGNVVKELNDELVIMNTGLIYDNNLYLSIKQIDIISIVTKEQFSNMEYRIAKSI